MSRDGSKLFTWLKANLGRHCLAPCTDTDMRLLLAAGYIADAWGGADYENKDRLARAYCFTVSSMQPSVQALAFHIPAHFLDWGHRAELWFSAGLPPIKTPRCKFGPPPPAPAPTTAPPSA